MVSQTIPKLPVIDLSSENLKPGSTSWFSARQDVVSALEEYGAFVAIYDKVSSQLSNSLFAATEELFDLPTEIKMKNNSSKPSHGYDEYWQFLPLYESLAIDGGTNIEQVESFTNLMWPAGNNRFCETAHSYSNLAADLDRMVTRMVFESYGTEKYHDSYVESIYYLLRFIKYRPPQMNEDNLGSMAHTDKSFTTVIHTNQVNGLEMKTKDSDEWHDVEVPPSSFIFLAGDAFMAWSNCRVHSYVHRVIMKADKPRYTVVQFAFSNGIVETPKELVDEEHPLRYKPFNHIGLIGFAFTEEGKRAAESLIEAYCGV